MAHSPTPSSPECLESWKEIAQHFGTTTRTVQKWEVERGLPVRRLPGPRGRVYAVKSEVDAWLALATQPTAPATPEAPKRLPWKPWAWALGLVLVALSFLLGAKSFREVPLASHRLEGRILIALDARGHEVWRYDLGGPVSMGRMNYLGESGGPWFGDLDGDGSSEMLFVHPLPVQDSGSDRLLCFSHSGDLKWSFVPGRKVATSKEQFDPPFRTNGFRVVRLGVGKGFAVLSLAFHNLYYPFQVALLSPQGKVLREYWHSGHIPKVAVGDLDGDGKDEIYLGGVCNSRKEATLVALDSETMTGASHEEDADYQLLGFAPPREVARILLPVGRPARGLSPYNSATDVRLTHGEIAVTVYDAPGLSTAPPPVNYFHFSAGFDLLRVSAADSYSLAMKLAGRDGERMTAKDLEDLKHITYLTRPREGLALSSAPRP
jgi:hypothetical protein